MAETKRTVPPALKNLLQLDAKLTSGFCHAVEKMYSPLKMRKYLKALEISCHGLPWLAVWLAFFWILWNTELFEMQVNFLIGLLLDMVLVTIVKALARRRRPPGNKPDMFMAYGTDVYSFPSGHSSRAVLISIFFSSLYPTNAFVQIILHIWVVGVSVSRILLKRHFIMDVAAGAFLGYIESAILSILWINKANAIWFVTWLSDERVNLEGLQDGHEIDVD